jgi:hypothetical protein
LQACLAGLQVNLHLLASLVELYHLPGQC